MAKKVNLDIAQKLNITCRRGDTFRLSLTLKDADGDPLTLVTNSYQFVMQVRDSAKSDGETGLILSTIYGRPINADPNTGTIEAMGPESTDNINDSGIVNIVIPDTVMRSVPSGRYVYDLQYVINDTTHTTILEGAFVVNEDVSEYIESPSTS
tara:strand:- start:423 stop:881 length:459 start_codon:yes stop_codon:yes gene_type:complete